MPGDKLYGWRDITSFTLVGNQIINRWIKLYAFPKPERVRSGKKVCLVWDTQSVMDWMAENEDVLDDAFKHLNKCTIKARRNKDNINEQGFLAP